MEQSYRKNRNSSRQKAKNTFSAKPKTRKKGREKSQIISGFSTLSQVSGAPLVKHYRSSIPVIPPKTLIEPYEKCVICSEKIDTIADAFSLSNGFAHFDCVLERIRESEVLGDGDTVSYIGSGSFGICHKGSDGKYTILKKIDVESKENYQNFKDYVESLKQ